MNEYLTFDDVLIKPKYSEITSRENVNIKSYLTKNIKLNIPIISANMDTITESNMAIEMALNGGIGIIHRFCSIKEQVKMVEKVKRYTNYCITDPYTIHPEITIEVLKEQMNEKNVSSFLVRDTSNILLGIVTKRDILYSKILDNKVIKVKDIMVPFNKLICTDDININIDTALKIMISKRIEKLPVINEYHEIIGLITAKDLLLHKYSRNEASLDNNYRLLCGAAIGVNDDYLQRASELIKVGIDVLVIDVAHGHSLLVGQAINNLKEYCNSNNIICPDIIAGNVCTKEGVKYLAECGADAIKVNIGAGSICTTRIITGCGMPQLSAVIECSNAAREYNIPIIGDGGHNGKIGNIFKCIAAGASCVMLGGFLSGTDETPGEIIIKNGKKMKMIRGMAGYISNNLKNEKIGYGKKIDLMCPEGVEGYVEYKGDVQSILNQIIKGIKSGMSYIGSENIKELRKSNIEFIKITNSGKIESGSHNIQNI